MAAPVSLTVLRRAFADICRGYSSTVYARRPLYIRHLSHLEHIGYDEMQAAYEAAARAQGGKTEAEKLADLRAAGRWTDAKEKAILRQQDGIARFEDTIRNTPQPSVAHSMAQQLEEERAKLRALLEEKGEMMGMTVETYAQRRLNDHYIVTNLFADPALERPLFEPSLLEEMEPQAVDELLTVYHAAIGICADDHLRQLCVQSLFTDYWNVANDDASAFFGRPVHRLTYYQIRLASIARYFKAILEGVDLTKVPPSVRGDPDAIERYFTSQKAIEQQKAEGKLPANMSQSDVKTMGLEGQYAQVTKAESAIDMVRRLSGGGKPG